MLALISWYHCATPQSWWCPCFLSGSDRECTSTGIFTIVMYFYKEIGHGILFSHSGPPQVTGVEIALESTTSRMVSWQSIYHATYKLRVQRVGDPPTCFLTDCNEFLMENLCHNSTYVVSVTAKILDQEGKESERQQFETGNCVRVTLKKHFTSMIYDLKHEGGIISLWWSWGWEAQ